MKILVLDGDTRPALAITRSLGRLGHEIIVAAAHQPSLASASRYCTVRAQYPRSVPDADQFIAWLQQAASAHKVDLVVPVTEITTWLTAVARDQLPAGCRTVLPDTNSLQVANDKSAVLRLAQELGIQCPRTRVLAARDDLKGVGADWSFPLVLKPARSRVLTNSSWISGSVAYLRTARELSAKLAAMPAALFPVLLQERVAGPGVGVFACCQNGRPVALFSHRRIREKPPSGGVSTLCESIPLDPLASAHAGKLLAALNWHGVAMVEFKRDERDGALRLLEINGRFWGSLQLAVDAGVDFPALLAQMAAGDEIEPVTTYTVGRRLRWFLGDLDSLLAVLLRRRSSLGLPDGFPGRFQALWNFCQSGPDQRGETLRRDDPGPGLLELRRWLSGG